MKARTHAEQLQRKRDATKTLKDRNAAVADVKEAKRKIMEFESIGSCKHAIKTFTLAELGEGCTNAGGNKGKQFASRF